MKVDHDYTEHQVDPESERFLYVPSDLRPSTGLIVVMLLLGAGLCGMAAAILMRWV